MSGPANAQRFFAEAKVAAHDHAERYAPSTPAPPKQSELELLKDQLGRRLEYAAQLGGRLENAMDYVCGAAPQPTGPVGTGPVPAGFIGTVEAGLEHLGELLSRIDSQVSRLERVVG